MNNKGFMMAEVIVVASIILLSLTGFYALYTKTISVYNDRLDYNDISTLYRLAMYRDTGEYNLIDETDLDVDTNDDYVKQEDTFFVDGESVYLVEHDKLGALANSIDLNETFREYLIYLSSLYHKDGKYNFKYNDFLLVMEKCNKKDSSGKYILDCKYAFLETAVK